MNNLIKVNIFQTRKYLFTKVIYKLDKIHNKQNKRIKHILYKKKMKTLSFTLFLKTSCSSFRHNVFLYVNTSSKIKS
jgi:hypothetical protein